MTERVSLMLVAGEASGDAHAAALANALRQSAPQTQFEFTGSTGPRMREAGVESIVHADDLAIMGLFEVGRALPKFWGAYRNLKRSAIESRPDAVVLVDWPDFNLRLARALHRKGIRVIYYISPQLWAWRSYRIRNIRRDVDLLLSILPFEKPWYSERGVSSVEFVGHPLTGEVHAQYDRAEFCARHGLDQSKPIVSLLPGSRHKEIERILPRLLDAALELSRSRPDVQFVLALAPHRSRQETDSIMASRNHDGSIARLVRTVQGESREALAASDVAAIASGTATLEAAILGTPMVIVYRESTVNWHVLGSMIDVEHYGLVNLIAGERLVTELMQSNLTGKKVSEELLALLDKERNEAMRKRLQQATLKLGTGDASRRAATAILKKVREWR